ncbi:MAG: HNH endonuclease [Acidimicrobiia bacterium]
MPPTRAELALEIAARAGESFVIDDAANGWPALGRVASPDGDIPVALFAAPVGLSHRGRDEVERRFQNPAANAQEHADLGWNGRPLIVPPDRVPLLVGAWLDDGLIEIAHPVFVLADARKREGLTTRHSMFVRVDALVECVAAGWSENVNTDGEVMPCLYPELLPAMAEAAAADVALPFDEVALAVEAAGVAAGADDSPVERGRRSVSSIVRDARFSRSVIDAYEGLCAMCGLDLGLVQGAHIYPASAPASPDEVTNGLCLCSNHHAAFDRHLIWIDPTTRTVKLSPEILEQAGVNGSAAAFVDSTLDVLTEPVIAAARPLAAMFDARYSYFETRYDWAAM